MCHFAIEEVRTPHMSTILYGDPDHQPFSFDAGPSRALLIHGFLGSPRDMRPLARELAEAGVTARGLLLPGFAQDPDQLQHVRATDWLNAARAAWIETRAGASRSTLIGFSMGGAIALRLAAEAGLAPDQLILLAPHWKFADRRAAILPVGKWFIRRFNPFGRIDFDNPDTRRMLADLAPGADIDDPAVRRQLRNVFSIPTHALDELRRINGAAAAAARRLSAPAVILQGMQDRTSLPTYSRRLARRIGADLLEFPGDHLIVDPNRPSWTTVRDAIIQRTTHRDVNNPLSRLDGRGTHEVGRSWG
jgi:carboxylesterase